MKILVVVSDFPKVTETFAILNVLHYLSRGHDARVFHLKPFRHKELVHDEAKQVVERAFTYPWLQGPSLRALCHAAFHHPVRLSHCVSRLVAATWKEPKRLLASFAILPKSLALGRYAAENDIEHIHAEFAGYPATAAWVASCVFDVPFSFSSHMHDIFVSQALLAEKSQRAQFVRTISQYNRAFLSRIKGFDARKISVIRCGVEPGRFPDDTVSLPDPESAVNITFVGSLYERKGVDVLLRALTRLEARPDWHLNILGGGPEADRLKKMAARDLPGRVTFHGPASMADVTDALRAAHMVVVPSAPDRSGRSEGIPVVVMEALAAGRPVIASRLTGIPELVEDGVTGYLSEPGDDRQLAEKIDLVMTDFARALRLAERGRARVLEDYNLDKNAADLLAMIEKAA